MLETAVWYTEETLPAYSSVPGDLKPGSIETWDLLKVTMIALSWKVFGKFRP